jgi:hypothetical protein
MAFLATGTFSLSGSFSFIEIIPVDQFFEYVSLLLTSTSFTLPTPQLVELVPSGFPLQ